jgi:(2S)-methylsuccinyl-CoA dehydrogenase
MPIAATRPAAGNDLAELTREAVAAFDSLLGDATAKVRERVVVEGHVVSRLLDREQRAAHGLAWRLMSKRCGSWPVTPRA